MGFVDGLYKAHLKREPCREVLSLVNGL
jgi:hypothetical protein